MGCGFINRPMDAAMMKPEATRIIAPSSPAEKYSALEWPNSWSRSAGLAMTLSTTTATTAATRFTSDSAASESKPTDPVTR